MTNKKGAEMTIGTIIVIILALVILVIVIYGFQVGWDKLLCQLRQGDCSEINNCDENETVCIRDIPNKNYEEICYYNYYNIEYVDGFLQDNCYGFINKNMSNENSIIMDILNSINNTFAPYEYFKEKGWNCITIRDLGNIYCLKDKSKCLIIKGEICNIINIS